MRSMSQVHPISDLYSHTIEAHVEFEKEKKGIIQFRVNEKKNDSRVAYGPENRK